MFGRTDLYTTTQEVIDALNNVSDELREDRDAYTSYLGKIAASLFGTPGPDSPVLDGLLIYLDEEGYLDERTLRELIECTIAVREDFTQRDPDARPAFDFMLGMMFLFRAIQAWRAYNRPGCANAALAALSCDRSLYLAEWFILALDAEAPIDSFPRQRDIVDSPMAQHEALCSMQELWHISDEQLARGKEDAEQREANKVKAREENELGDKLTDKAELLAKLADSRQKLQEAMGQAGEVAEGVMQQLPEDAPQEIKDILMNILKQTRRPGVEANIVAIEIDPKTGKPKEGGRHFEYDTETGEAKDLTAEEVAAKELAQPKDQPSVPGGRLFFN